MIAASREFARIWHAVVVASRNYRSVTRAVKRIDSASERRVSLAELAALEGASRFQLPRAFSSEAGITPRAYLIQRRVILARRFLRDGQTPAEAAIQAGLAARVRSPIPTGSQAKAPAPPPGINSLRHQVGQAFSLPGLLTQAVSLEQPYRLASRTKVT